MFNLFETFDIFGLFKRPSRNQYSLATFEGTQLLPGEGTAYYDEDARCLIVRSNASNVPQPSLQQSIIDFDSANLTTHHSGK